jgi:tellurite resistance-related uncharacterized protein
MQSEPYKRTPDFDQDSLPEAIRNAHSTKAGTWGMLVVSEGAARLVFHEPAREVAVTPGSPGKIAPQAVHHVELDGPVRLHVEFYKVEPGEG